MIFYVYFDPQIISEALTEGNASVQNLTGILRGLSQNCFLAEFKNFSIVQDGISEKLKDTVGDFDTKALKIVLSRFAKDRLFVECLDYDYTPGATEADMAQKQCVAALLDLLILPETATVLPENAVDIATLRNYHSVEFERKRSELAADGATLAVGEMDEDEFFENYFLKALKYARTIVIVDYQLGEKYKSNFDYTLQKFLGWLKKANVEDLSITVHCGFPDALQSSICSEDDLDNEIRKQKLEQAINSHYDKSTIAVVCYEQKFIHDRYVITDQTAFLIGVGMDFLQNSGSGRGKIRQIDLSLKNPKKVLSLLSGSH
jgi:hypothetical protein